MVFKGGVRRVNETTTLLGDQHVLKGKNFIPDNSGISVRSGMTTIARIDNEQDQTKTNLPLAMKSVNISGEDIVLIVQNNCVIQAVFPNRTGCIYDVRRRYFDVDEKIILGNDSEIPNNVDILEVGNYIYILSPVRSWVIYRDGMLKIEQTTVGVYTTGDYITVDALDATIMDLDNETLRLVKTGDTASLLQKGDLLFARFRSEFGGRGSASLSTKLTETNSYVVEVSNSLKRYYIASGENTTHNKHDRYYPICYMHSNGAEQRKTSRENQGVDQTRYVKVLKNVFASGILAQHAFVAGTTNRITIACKTGDNNHLTIGTKVGLTLPTNHYNSATNTTWVDGVIVENPSPLPDIFCDNICITVEYDAPGARPLALGPSAFNPDMFDADTDMLVTAFQGVDYAGVGIRRIVLFQTVDGKKYTTLKYYQRNEEGGSIDQINSIITQISGGSFPISTILYTVNNDVLLNPVTFFPLSEIVATGNGIYFYGKYKAVNFDTAQHSYSNAADRPFFRYQRTVADADEKSCIFTTNTESLFLSNGQLDGTELECDWYYGEEPTHHLTRTWFKDRAYSPTIPIIAYEEDQKDYYFLSPLIVISEPHNVTRGAESYTNLNTYITAPSEKCGCKFPVATNLWYQPKYHDDGKASVAYNPFCLTNESGEPILQNVSPSRDDFDATHYHDIHDSLILCYDSAAITTEDGESVFKNGYYEIYRQSSFGDNTPIKIGEELNLINLTIDFTHGGEFRIFTGNPDYVDAKELSTYYYQIHHPIYLTNVRSIAAATTGGFVRSVGDFRSAAHFNGKMYFASNNVVKETNEYLEWDPVNTYEVGGIIKQLVSLNNMLFIFTDDGIYTMNSEKKIEKFSSVKAYMGAVSGEKLMIVGENGKIYHTEFAPVPISSQWQLTQNPYIIVEDDSEIIKNLSETWTVYDVASTDDRFFVASNKGVWVYHGATKSWWEAKYPLEPLRLTRWRDKVIAVGGNFIDAMKVGIQKFKDISLFKEPPS